MAHKRLKEPKPGEPGFVPWNDELRRAHADALAQSHAGHQCAMRAVALTEAGEYYAILGEHDLAEPLYKEAIEIEDAEPGLAHAYYASFLFRLGRTPEGFDLINQARRLNPDHAEVFQMIGETLLEHDHAQQAARWLTLGIVRHLGPLTSVGLDDVRYDFELAMLAETRRVARDRLGLAPDHIDEIVEELRRERATRD